MLNDRSVPWLCFCSFSAGNGLHMLSTKTSPGGASSVPLRQKSANSGARPAEQMIICQWPSGKLIAMDSYGLNHQNADQILLRLFAIQSFWGIVKDHGAEVVKSLMIMKHSTQWSLLCVGTPWNSERNHHITIAPSQVEEKHDMPKWWYISLHSHVLLGKFTRARIYFKQLVQSEAPASQTMKHMLTISTSPLVVTVQKKAIEHRHHHT